MSYLQPIELTRRQFLRRLAGLGVSVAGLPMLAGCQVLPSQAPRPTKTPRVAYLWLWRYGPSRPFGDSFRQGLRDLGYVDGQNITIDMYDAQGSTDRLEEIVTELTRGDVDVFVVACTPEAKVAQKVTDTIPIVFSAAGDPVKAGLVESMAHPGGNITGLSSVVLGQSAKRLDLLKEAFPHISRAAVLWNPARPDNKPEFQVMETAAQALGVQLQSLEVHQIEDFERAFQAIIDENAEAVLNLGDTLLSRAAPRIVSFAAQRRLPALYENREYVDQGGLMSYGPSFPELHRRAAGYVDKILKGATPADLPVERISRFEFVINLKAAQAIGATIPQSVLAQADDVIR
ncbi:MAG: ABC transporter substrate-binding protein [Anaerolineae bacterium]